jgi:hypothetical protein
MASKQKNFRLSQQAQDRLKALSEHIGTSESAVVEAALAVAEGTLIRDWEVWLTDRNGYLDRPVTSRSVSRELAEEIVRYEGPTAVALRSDTAQERAELEAHHRERYPNYGECPYCGKEPKREPVDCPPMEITFEDNDEPFVPEGPTLLDQIRNARSAPASREG